MRKRLISCLLAAFIGFSVMPIPRVMANPISYSVESSKRVISVKMNDLKRKSALSYDGDVGILYYMDSLSRYALWIDFLKQDAARSDSLKMGQAELNDYVNSYTSAIKAGNTKYSNYEIGGSNFKIAENASTDVILNNAAKVINHVIQPVIDKYKKATTDEEKDAVKKDNKNLLKYAYRIVYGIQDEVNEINNVIPLSNLGSSSNVIVDQTGTPNYKTVWTYSPNISMITNIANSAEAKELLAYAKDISELDLNATGNIALNNAESLVDQFVTSGDTKELSTAYYAFLATSAIYVPFESHAGDELFLDTAASLINKEEKETKIMLDSYSQLKSYKKPLYYRETNEYGEGVDSAYIATLQTLIDKLENEENSEFVLGKGKIEMNLDTNTYDYYNGTNNAVGSGYVENLPEAETNGEGEQAEEGEEEQQEEQDNGTDAVENKETTEGISLANVGEPLASETSMTEPVLRIGSYDVNTAANDVTVNKELVAQSDMFGWDYITPETIVLTNMLASCQKKISNFEPENEILFMNAFGDIVLADDTIVFPAAANFNFYNEGWSYYANTAITMNYYPRNVLATQTPESAEGVYSETPKDMVDKYMVGYHYNDNEHVTDVLKWDNHDFRTDVHRTVLFQLTEKRANGKAIVSQGWDTRVILGDEITDMMKAYDISHDNNGFWDSLADLWTDFTDQYYRAYQPYNFVGASMFPINGNYNDVSLESAKMIANNMYAVYMTDKDGNANPEGANDMINDGYLISHVVLETANGITNSGSLLKTISNTSDFIIDNQAGIMTKTAADLFDAELNHLGDIEGVMGVKTAYQDEFFGSILGFLREYIWVGVIAIFLFITIMYMRNSAGFFTSVILAGLVSLGLYVVINIVPVVVPNAYNFAVEIFSEKLAYKSLMYKVEQYDQTYGGSANVDESGRFSKRTTSIDLKSLTNTEFDLLVENQHLDKDVLLSGGAAILDATNGVYIEGKVIKLNVDRLFYTFPITGEEVETANGLIQYQLSADKMYSSNIDYYMPFYSIAQNFTDNVNSFSRIYQLQRETIAYSADLEKDSFFVKSFMCSIPFLTPGVYTNEDGTQLTTDPDQAVLLMELQGAFGDELDFLGIRQLLETSDQTIKDTLWYQTAQQNNLLGDKAIDATVERVNNLTKEFMIKNYYNFKQMSDENIIKTVSLFAATQLNASLSNPWNTVNPITLNFEELSLKDVLICALVDDYNLFTNADIDLTEHLLEDYGFFSIVGLIIGLLEIFVIVNVIKYSIPFLYLLVFVLFLWKFKTGDNKVNLIKGYLTCNGFIFGSFAVFCGMLSLIERIAGNAFNTVIILIVCTAILYVLLDIVIGIIKNFTELGYGYTGKSVKTLFNNTVLKLPGVKQIVGGLGRGSRKLVNTSLDAYAKYGQKGYDPLDDGKVASTIRRHNRNYEDFISGYDS